jgi:hypothetical protein
MPALNESEYYRNLGVEMKPIGASSNARPGVSSQIANDLLGDLGQWQQNKSVALGGIRCSIQIYSTPDCQQRAGKPKSVATESM